MPDNGKLSRRKLLKYTGVGAAASVAGCTGSSGDGAKNQFAKESSNIAFGKNWKQRRLTDLNEWPIEKRQAIPSSENLHKVDAWKKSESVKSAPWKPPEGWKDTAAAEVDKLQVLNFGSLEYDPATVATYAMFEEATGIEIEPLEVVVDQAIPKEAAFLQAKEAEPHAFLVATNASLTSFVQNGYLEAVDSVMPKEEMWDPYLPLAKGSFHYDGHTYLSPNINEGSLVHVRPDLIKQQGVSDDVLTRILDGSYTWSDMETVMEAFKGTDVAGWAFRGGSLTYTARDYMKMMYQAGGKIVQDDGSVKFNGDAHVYALEKMVEWRERELVPSEVTNYGQGDLADGFLSGQIAMVPVYGDLTPRAVDKFGADGKKYKPTIVPKGDDGAPAPTRAGIATPTGFGINSFTNTKHKLAASLYMDARWSQMSSWWEFVVEGNQPYATSVYDEASETGAALYPEVRGKAMELNVSEVYPQQRVLRQKLSEEVQVTLAGDKSPTKALDAVQEYADTVLGN